MKKLAFILFSVIITGLACCKSKVVKVTYESDKKDTATRLHATQIYILKKATENSDFNYSKLDGIDDHKIERIDIKNLMPLFEPIGGDYKYYQFLSTFIGEGYNGDGPVLEEFHEILIIKTDNKNKIIDAYQYTLEWGERPLQYDVFKSTAKNIVLTDNLDITKLKFMRTYSWSGDDKELNKNGIIKLK